MTKRLLITGMTPIQCGSSKTTLGLISNLESWKSSAEELGYQVDWRSVAPGEDLSTYHRVIVALNDPLSIASNYLHGAMWAVASRPDAFFAYDDWQTRKLVVQFRRTNAERRHYWRLQRKDQALALELKDALERGLAEVGTSPWSRRVIVPVFSGGDVTLLGSPIEPRQYRPLDPTPAMRRYPVPRVERERKWVSASLINKERFIPENLAWPVERFGFLNRAPGGVGAHSVGGEGQRRLKEHELMGVYASATGVFSLPHNHSGSGWYRVRFVMSRDAGAIVCACLAEASVLGQSYADACDPRAVEAMSDAQIARLAVAQRKDFDRVTWTLSRLEEELAKVLRQGGRC